MARGNRKDRCTWRKMHPPVMQLRRPGASKRCDHYEKREGEVEKRRRGQIVRVRGKRSTGVQWPVWKKERQRVWFAAWTGQRRWKRNDEDGEKQCCALGTAGHSENKKRELGRGRGAAAPRMMRNERRPSPGPLDGRPVASTRANLKAITGVLGSFVNGGVRINCKSSGSLSRTPTRSYSLRYHYFLVLLLTCRFNNTGATVFRAGQCVTAMEAAMILHDLSFVQGK